MSNIQNDLAPLRHERRALQTELEMQNVDLRRAQLDIEESRNRYIDLYEFAPIGYLTLTRDGTISEVNLTGAALLGMARKKLSIAALTALSLPTIEVAGIATS